METIRNPEGGLKAPFRVFCYTTEGYVTEDGETGHVEEVLCWHVTRESFFAIWRDACSISCEIEELPDGRWRWHVDGAEGVAGSHQEARERLPRPIAELRKTRRSVPTEV